MPDAALQHRETVDLSEHFRGICNGKISLNANLSDGTVAIASGHSATQHLRSAKTAVPFSFGLNRSISKCMIAMVL
jgi:hypothetical protein